MTPDRRLPSFGVRAVLADDGDARALVASGLASGIQIMDMTAFAEEHSGGQADENGGDGEVGEETNGRRLIIKPTDMLVSTE